MFIILLFVKEWKGKNQDYTTVEKNWVTWQTTKSQTVDTT